MYGGWFENSSFTVAKGSLDSNPSSKTLPKIILYVVRSYVRKLACAPRRLEMLYDTQVRLVGLLCAHGWLRVISHEEVPLLTLINGANKLSCYGIVDSGADHCVFPRSFIQPLGLDPLTAPVEMSAGVGSSNVPTHFCNVAIDLGPIRISVYAGFTSGMDQLG